MSTWQIDTKHSAATFTIRHMMSKVRGTVGVVAGTIEGDESDWAHAKVAVTLDARSINTGVTERDNHLRSGDVTMFEVEKYPTVTFTSTRIEGEDPSSFKVIGDLTIKGVTREVVLDTVFHGAAKNPWGQRTASFTAETKVNRKDFNLTWNAALETGGWLVGDEVTIDLSIEASPAQAAVTKEAAAATV
jgi:polyisoprenoid-binding protein YceI